MDLFAVPVGLTYRREKYFKSGIGGCFSLLIVLAFVAYTAVTLNELGNHPTLTSNAEKTYFSRTSNTEGYDLSTIDSTVAVKIQAQNTTADEMLTTSEVNSLLRVVFWQWTSETEYVQLPTVLCSEFYADEFKGASSDFFEDTFDSERWVCPDTTNLSFLNAEIQVHVNVHSCDYASNFEYSAAYGNETCTSFTDTQASFSEVAYAI